MTVKQAHEITKCIRKRLGDSKDIYDVVVHVEPEGNNEKEPYGLSQNSSNSANGNL
jgi:divalent metal cation (Fe/Co/Zn/Cd) transporter